MRKKLDWKFYGILAIIFGFLFAFAGYAWFERVNSDAGYYLFHALSQRGIYVEHQRYVLAFAELPAILAVYFHASLKTVLVFYSIGHVLFFFLACVLALLVSQNKGVTLFLALLSIAGLRESVYTPQFELYYGLVFVVLSYVFYTSDLKSAIKWPLLFVCIILGFTSHPFAVLCATFIFVIYSAEIRVFKWRFALIYGAIICLYVIWKKTIASVYETGKIDLYLTAIASKKYVEVLTWQNLAAQWILLKNHYPDLVLFFLLGTGYFAWNKKYGRLCIYVFSWLLIQWLIVMLYPGVKEVFRYLEQVYFPLVFFSLSFLIFIKNHKANLLVGVILICLIYRIVVILHTYPIFEKRTQLMDKFIAKSEGQAGQRFFVTKEEMGEVQYNLGDWSYGFETLLRSVATKKKTITITKDEDLYFNGNDSLLKPDEWLFRMWERENVKVLNQDYFKLNPGHYERLK